MLYNALGGYGGYGMRFLVYGAGVIGSIFAAKLALAGFDVTVLARGRRYEEIAENGIVLKEVYSKKTLTAKVSLIDRLGPDDIYDYILVAMQKAQASEVLNNLAQNGSPNIVFIVNNPSGFEEWVNAVGAKRLMIGFPSAGGERKDGTVHCFIGRGLTRIFQTTTFGEYCSKRTERLSSLISAFNKAGIPSVINGNMDAWLKTHAAVVTSIANALYKHGSDNFSLARDTGTIRLMVRGIKEGFKVIEALGYNITPLKLCYFKLPGFIIAGIFQIVMNTRIAEFAMAKHTITARSEMVLLQKEFDELIRKSHVETPAINMLNKSVIV
jgi:2-dehydropantoate 2-reductase